MQQPDNTNTDPIAAAAARDWAASPALQAEFAGRPEWYTALRRAESTGLVKVHAPARAAAGLAAAAAAPIVAPAPAAVPLPHATSSAPVAPQTGTAAPTPGPLDLTGLDVEGLVSRTTRVPRAPAGGGQFNDSGMPWPRFLTRQAASIGQPWWIVALREPEIYQAHNVDLELAREELRLALGRAQR